MKIVFICGSLEVGRDGVGDYTRRLAGELIRTGHQAAILAINDRYLISRVEGIQEDDVVKIETLRIPSNLSIAQKDNMAKNWIKSLDPDWVSLQFVPFSFHSRGLPHKMGSRLNSILKGRSVHLMFHELWVGMDEKSSWKYRIWGNLQKAVIRSLLYKAKPKITHTQTKLYQAYLNRMGIPAQYLPLFSNIPNKSIAARVKETEHFQSGISMVIFGGIFSGTPVEIFSEEAGRFSRETGVTITLKVAGRNGAEQKKWLSSWVSNGLPIENMGERPEEEVSEFLSSSDFGISTTPLPVIEKSGSVAAMLAHNLPIISVAKLWKPSLKLDIEAPKWVVEYQPGNFAYCISNRSYPQGHSLSSVSKQFIQSLNRY